MPVRFAATAVLVAAVTTACTSVPPTPHTDLSVPAGIQGYMLILAGTNAASLDVYELQLHPYKMTKITTTAARHGVDRLFATDQEVVVSVADLSNDDRVGRLQRDGQIVAFPNFQDPIASAFHVFDDGSFGYEASHQEKPGAVWERALRLYDPKTAQTTTVLPSTTVGFGFTWGPDHSLAFINRATPRAAVIQWPDGHRTEFAHNLGDIPSLSWGAQDVIAVNRADNPWTSTLVRRDGSEIAHVSGWLVTSWSPDRTRAVLIGRHGHIAVWDPSTGKVMEIGSFGSHSRVTDVSWTGADPWAAPR